MLVDLDLGVTEGSDVSYDVIIVGAGTLGLFAASLINKTVPSIKIAILEAGGLVPEGFAEMKTQDGKRHIGVNSGRANGLGGTSNLWGGQLAEFDEIDIERRSSAWGFSFAELRKYYDQVYRLLGIDFKSGDESFHKAFVKRKGLKLDPLEFYLTNWLNQPNFSILFSSLIKKSKCHTYINATATDIFFNGGEFVGLEVNNCSNQVFKFRAQKIFFACGTLQNSQFFLSTARLGSVPWAQNPNVGAYFQDHIAGDLGRISIRNKKLFRDIFENGWVNGNKVQPKFKLNPHFFGDTQTSVALSVRYTSRVTDSLENLKMTIRNFKASFDFSTARTFFADIFRIRGLIFPLVIRYIKDRRILAVFDDSVFLHGQGEQLPLRDSRIMIDESLPTGKKLKNLKLDWRVSGAEMLSFYQSAIETKRFFKNNGIGDIEINSLLLAKDSKFLDTLNDSYHMSGGLVSSASPDRGVVNTFQRVWGCENVWVLGSSTFPSSSHANTTLTALALCLRTVENVFGLK